MTSAPAPSETETAEAGTAPESADAPTCESCPHPWEDHDAIARRFCSASRASERSDQGCACRK